MAINDTGRPGKNAQNVKSNKSAQVTKGQIEEEEHSVDQTPAPSSTTSSSDDEVISNVSLHQGFNPCKCCVGDECNLRSHCMGIGSFWIVLILMTVFTGLITRKSEPAIYEEAGAMPSFKRETSRTNDTLKSASGKKTTAPGYGSLITLPPIIVGDSVLGAESEEDEDQEGVEATTRFETFLHSEYGEAVRILRPDTLEGLANWQENLDKYLVVIAINFICVVLLSIISGVLCFVGAYTRKSGILKLHIATVSVTALLTLTLGLFLTLLHGFTQLFFCVICAGFYVYFATCSYGLVTVIKAGAFDDFDFEGVAYTYSTVLRAKIPKDSSPKRREEESEVPTAAPPPNQRSRPERRKPP